jgi:hypothetical protein
VEMGIDSPNHCQFCFKLSTVVSGARLSMFQRLGTYLVEEVPEIFHGTIPQLRWTSPCLGIGTPETEFAAPSGHRADVRGPVMTYRTSSVSAPTAGNSSS